MQPDVRPSRVLMTCDAVGGIWRYAVDLAGALRERGVETLLVGTGPRPRPEAMAELDVPPVWLDAAPTWLAGRPSDVLRIADELGLLQRRSGADLVHLNQPAEAAFLDVEAPVVVAAHSCLATWWQDVKGGEPPPDWRWRTDLEADGFRRADAVVAPSAAYAKAVAQTYGIPSVAVVPNASDAPPGGAGREAVAVAAARWWDAGKNLAVLDAAAARCRWPVHLYGSLSGPDGTRAIARHARVEGQRPSDELRDAMRRAAVFVSPSLYEPFGLAALEAARSGAALLLADIPTYRELWQGAARFFDPRSPGALAASLDALADDDAERSRLAAAGERRAAEFTTDRQVGALLQAYARAIHAGGKLRPTG